MEDPGWEHSEVSAGGGNTGTEEGTEENSGDLESIMNPLYELREQLINDSLFSPLEELDKDRGAKLILDKMNVADVLKLGAEKQRLKEQEDGKLVSRHAQRIKDLARVEKRKVDATGVDVRNRIAAERKRYADAVLRKKVVRHNIEAYFQQARSRLKSFITTRRAQIVHKYGDMTVIGGKQFNIEDIAWDQQPQQVGLHITSVRGLKDKVPKGNYTLLISKVDKLGGEPFKWSLRNAKSSYPPPCTLHPDKNAPERADCEVCNGWVGCTVPHYHSGKSSAVDLPLDTSVFTFFPPRKTIKPYAAFVFELVRLPSRYKTDGPGEKAKVFTDSAEEVPVTVGWSAFPVINGHFTVIKGKFKTPLLRGPIDPAVQHHRHIARAVSDDIESWIGNLYFEVAPYPRVCDGKGEFERQGEVTAKRLGLPAQERMRSSTLKGFDFPAGGGGGGVGVVNGEKQSMLDLSFSGSGRRESTPGIPRSHRRKSTAAAGIRSRVNLVASAAPSIRKPSVGRSRRDSWGMETGGAKVGGEGRLSVFSFGLNDKRVSVDSSAAGGGGLLGTQASMAGRSVKRSIAAMPYLGTRCAKTFDKDTKNMPKQAKRVSVDFAATAGAPESHAQLRQSVDVRKKSFSSFAGAGTLPPPPGDRARTPDPFGSEASPLSRPRSTILSTLGGGGGGGGGGVSPVPGGGGGGGGASPLANRFKSAVVATIREETSQQQGSGSPSSRFQSAALKSIGSRSASPTAKFQSAALKSIGSRSASPSGKFQSAALKSVGQANSRPVSPSHRFQSAALKSIGSRSASPSGKFQSAALKSVGQAARPVSPAARFQSAALKSVGVGGGAPKSPSNRFKSAVLTSLARGGDASPPPASPSNRFKSAVMSSILGGGGGGGGGASSPPGSGSPANRFKTAAMRLRGAPSPIPKSPSNKFQSAVLSSMPSSPSNRFRSAVMKVGGGGGFAGGGGGGMSSGMLGRGASFRGIDRPKSPQDAFGTWVPEADLALNDEAIEGKLQKLATRYNEKRLLKGVSSAADANSGSSGEDTDDTDSNDDSSANDSDNALHADLNGITDEREGELLFDLLDENDDGTLSIEELYVGLEKFVEVKERLGVCDLTEFFIRLDANRDGKIDKHEFSAVWAATTSGAADLFDFRGGGEKKAAPPPRAPEEPGVLERVASKRGSLFFTGQQSFGGGGGLGDASQGSFRRGSLRPLNACTSFRQGAAAARSFMGTIGGGRKSVASVADGTLWGASGDLNHRKANPSGFWGGNSRRQSSAGADGLFTVTGRPSNANATEGVSLFERLRVAARAKRTKRKVLVERAEKWTLYTTRVNEATAISGESVSWFLQLEYCGRGITDEIVCTNPRELRFWFILSVFLVCLYGQLFLHGLGTYLTAAALGVPTSSIQPLWYGLRVQYDGNHTSAYQELCILLFSTVANLLAVTFFVMMAWVFKNASANLPEQISKFVFCLSISYYFFPFVQLVLDFAIADEENVLQPRQSDIMRVIDYYKANQYESIYGICTFIVIYLNGGAYLAVLNYLYTMHLHLNGILQDCFWRINVATDKTFFMPLDLEVSRRELDFICMKAERWRGRKGERKKTKVSLLLTTDDADPDYLSRQMHVEIYTLSPWKTVCPQSRLLCFHLPTFAPVSSAQCPEAPRSSR
ncbi:hypothetical protein DIPPA_27439, partial [Diplonema papillatum]